MTLEGIYEKHADFVFRKGMGRPGITIEDAHDLPLQLDRDRQQRADQPGLGQVRKLVVGGVAQVEDPRRLARGRDAGEETRGAGTEGRLIRRPGGQAGARAQPQRSLAVELAEAAGRIAHGPGQLVGDLVQDLAAVLIGGQTGADGQQRAEPFLLVDAIQQGPDRG